MQAVIYEMLLFMVLFSHIRPVGRAPQKPVHTRGLRYIYSGGTRQAIAAAAAEVAAKLLAVMLYYRLKLVIKLEIALFFKP